MIYAECLIYDIAFDDKEHALVVLYTGIVCVKKCVTFCLTKSLIDFFTRTHRPGLDETSPRPQKQFLQEPF
jgi:hypothetical protein